MRLSHLGNRLSWREFVIGVEGLLSCDCRLWRVLNAQHDEGVPDA